MSDEKPTVTYIHCKGCGLFIGKQIEETGEYCKLCGEEFELVRAS